MPFPNVLRLIDHVHSLTVPVLVPPVSSGNKQQVYLCVFMYMYVRASGKTALKATLVLVISGFFMY